jgi:prostaglandin-E synthase
MLIVKEEAEDDDAEFWPRLLKDKLLEKNQVKIDWDRYVDEDDEEEEGGFDMSNLEGGMGMGGMPPGMGGMPGMGGPGGPGGMDMASLVSLV